MTDPDPILWAINTLEAHGYRPLKDGEDGERLRGELLGLGWDVNWTERAPYEVVGQVKWLPVGVVRVTVQGQTPGEAAMFALAMALDVQGE